jgi:hypothetical protein
MSILVKEGEYPGPNIIRSVQNNSWGTTFGKGKASNLFHRHTKLVYEEADILHSSSPFTKRSISVFPMELCS